MEDNRAMTGHGEPCRVCFRDHPSEEYVCSACSSVFRCPSRTVAVTLGNGKTLRAHIVIGGFNPNVYGNDACGPVVRRLSKTETAGLAAAGARLAV